MGGARNIHTKPETWRKFFAVKKLMFDEPEIKLKDALERFKLAVTSYYRTKRKHEKAA